MPGTHESCKKCPASHTHALGELFISRMPQWCKGEMKKRYKSLRSWYPTTVALSPEVVRCEASSTCLMLLEEYVFFSPSGAVRFMGILFPQLTTWAALCRRFAAGFRAFSRSWHGPSNLCLITTIAIQLPCAANTGNTTTNNWAPG